MKQNIFRKLILIAVLLTGSHAFAHDFEAQNSDGVTIYYNITSSADLTLGVTSGLTKYSGDVVIPQTVIIGEATYIVTSIRGWAFSDCTGLTSVKIPNSVTSIGDEAFKNCTDLASTTIGNSVTSIGENAFRNCTSLNSIVLPNSVTEIFANAFEGCSSLNSITILNDITSFDNSTFINTGWYNKQSDGILYLDKYCLGYKGEKPTGTLMLKEGTKLIVGDAFADCNDLTSVTIPSSVIVIDCGAFLKCEGLTSINIPNCVTFIGECAFYRCSGLTSITIPRSVVTIDFEAFYGCSGLNEVICESVIPPAAYSPFDCYTKATLYVPVGSKETYANATGWNRFANIVEDDTKTGIESTLVDDVKISVDNGNIVVTGAANANVEVYNVNGQCVYNGTSTTISVAAKGLYIVKVNDKSFKVML